MFCLMSITLGTVGDLYALCGEVHTVPNCSLSTSPLSFFLSSSFFLSFSFFRSFSLSLFAE